jgi:hypothetical protein
VIGGERRGNEEKTILEWILSFYYSPLDTFLFSIVTVRPFIASSFIISRAIVRIQFTFDVD